MTLCFYTKTIYALLEILGFLLLQMTTSENHDLLMPQNEQGDRGKAWIPFRGSEIPVLGFHYHPNQNVRQSPSVQTLAPWKRRTGIAAVVASLVGRGAGTSA